jgi:hypothetical protein
MAHPYPPPPPPPRRGGGGKALPIAVGAGLAVGVFLGLILIRGTDPAGAEDGLAAADAGVAAPMDAAVATAKLPDAAPAPVIDAAHEPRKALLTFDVGPGRIDGIKLTVDGQEVSGDRFEIELGDEERREVEIVARAPRYRSFRDKVEVSADRTIDIKMRRRGGGRPSGSTTTRPGGIIDL